MEWVEERVGDGLASLLQCISRSELIYLHSKGDPDLEIESRSIYLGPIHNNGICSFMSLTLAEILSCVA